MKGDDPDLSRAGLLAKKLARLARNDDPAVVAAALVIFASENIKHSANGLGEARAYLKGMNDAIDGLLINVFPPSEGSPSNPP
jgi:hypothetical protein